MRTAHETVSEAGESGREAALVERTVRCRDREWAALVRTLLYELPYDMHFSHSEYMRPLIEACEEAER